MELKNLKLVKQLEAGAGESKDGKPWKKVIVLCDMQDGEYVKPIVLNAWGEAANKMQDMQIGTTFDTMVRVECREYNGKWYTNLVPWKVNVTAAPVIAGSDKDFDF